ncbi:succinyl-CoA ligase subunit alpha [Massariosphaeria phaeospora]|uniref:Succinyl-CoA ligase subunit alpha n=1 Tax=Massariosphaeria phaeospora TaxID=100035 RepID=A0A7C8MI48_9PLEO|nr:succinyl-CoA ligase subunit alpha [Massariosphaeria phaeospora]
MLPRTRCLSRNLSTTHRISHTSYNPFSTSSQRSGYDDTIQNLKIGRHTRVIFQGFTGKQATANAKESLQWGTHIVGGVKPNSSGEHLGLPVLPSVRAAMAELKPDATGIYVAAHQAAAAIEEAIEAEVPLIVAVAEHIPLHDIMRIHSMLSKQSKSRLVGANAPGIISAIGRCRIGFQPLPTFSPGHIGIVAKSGTLSYETVGSLTRAGLGQSLCIGMGGDVIAGTNFVDALKVFEQDDDTEAVIIVGELGGTAEEEAADWIAQYRKRVKDPKPIAAVIGGFQAPPGQVMGHAGAWTGLGEGTAESKYKALEAAGVTMVDHPAKFGGVMTEILARPGRTVRQSEHTTPRAQQRRSYHTCRFPARPQTLPEIIPFQQRRSYHLTPDHLITLLNSYNIPISPTPSSTSPSPSHFLGITVARSARSPSIITSPTTSPTQLPNRIHHTPFDYRIGPTPSTIASALSHLQLDAAPPKATAQTASLIHNLWALYREKEAITATVSLSVSTSEDGIEVHDPYLLLDDAAFKSNGRQSDLHARRDTSHVPAAVLEAEAHGIVYIPLEPAAQCATHLIGTLVNGAGLALNTLDVLALRLASPPTCTAAANFLDTGGKATAATISTSFKLILSDPRVSVVFVNIFGGLTLCDMIAEGIVLACREVEVGVGVGVRKPVVVRLRGTRESEGMEVLRRAGLESVFAVEGFEEAVQEVGRLIGMRRQAA